MLSVRYLFVSFRFVSLSFVCPPSEGLIIIDADVINRLPQAQMTLAGRLMSPMESQGQLSVSVTLLYSMLLLTNRLGCYTRAFLSHL
jgi:hypothetical protein